ncbi:MAG TPA: hypothetical protein VGP07_09835 [Polyangia bacterium]|jgi:hypothetical protein
MNPRLLPTTVVTLAVACLLASCKGHLAFDEGGCDDDSECGLATLHCDVVTSTCVACTADAQCAALGAGRDRCDTAAHVCVECGLDSDCGQGRGCRFRHCVTLCNSEGPTSACPSAAPYCEDDDDGFCVQCGDDLANACSMSTAAGPICGRLGTCVACQGNADCKAPTGRCETFSGRCVECLGTKDCSGATPVCDPTINRCVAPA